MIPEAHGGRLVDRTASAGVRDRRDAERADLATVRAGIDQLYDAEKIGIGAYSPLEGFMGPAELDSVMKTGRLPTGLPWTIPILFPVPGGPGSAGAGGLAPGDEVGIVDLSDRLVALLAIEEKFRLDRSAIARATYGTDDAKHPNVADLLGGGDEAWSGKVTLLRRLEPPGGRPEPGPAETRDEFRRRGWKTVAAYQCRNPPHTAHEYIQRLSLERDDVDGLFIHPVVGRLKKGDYRPDVILDAYEALVRHYYPASRVMMRPLAITMRYGGPKAALFLAIVRKNYGCGAYIVGRDQAGVGQYYEPYACHRIFDEYDLGILPLRYDESFFCRRCGWMASQKTCPHPPSFRAQASQTRIREALAKGEALPVEILRPEVAEVLGRPGVLLTA